MFNIIVGVIALFTLALFGGAAYLVVRALLKNSIEIKE